MSLVTVQIVPNEKISNPQGTTQWEIVSTITIVTLITYHLHVRSNLLRVKGRIPSRITKTKQ
jgi:hypothetical protein